ncbi:TBCD protein [Gloeopeniophorella convolvens]|nr:TBCD protein [Gloeopeniophorella convolvens]
MDPETEIKPRTRFEKYDDFLASQSEILSLGEAPPGSEEEARRRTHLMWRMFGIFAEYQEHAYLLDPFLEDLVTPVVAKLKWYAQGLVEGSFRLEDITTSEPKGQLIAPLIRVSHLLYDYLKFRGYKTIIRYFPHEIADLSIALRFAQILDQSQHSSSLWSAQYVALLWISLICMIPFDLAQFDEDGKEGQTAAAIEDLAQRSLSTSGLVRESAAVLLSRIYVRRDASAGLPAFLDWARSVAEEQNDIFKCLGVYQTLCEILKNGPMDILLPLTPSFLEAAQVLQHNPIFRTNASLRKLRTKLISRTALRLLPAVPRVSVRKGRVLYAADELAHAAADDEEDADVPEEIETVLEDLLQALQDRDTVVRWSAAKGIARISERLPADLARQVTETVSNLFTIHSIAVASLYDMPAIAESTWHGACLSCAELIRRGLIADDSLGNIIPWMIKALYFDIRKGAHSIGSNVRDAASYALWSLPRAYDPSSIAPFSGDLAKNLVSASAFDREVHVRRAASAAYQEYVGRTGIFPHGIDVLGKIDFFAVGVRRNAFLVAAPQVAQHDEYRSFLIDRLLNVILRHWDPVMRQLGAQSLRKLCELDLPRLGPDCAKHARLLLSMTDASDIHGGLTALIQLSDAFSGSADLETFRQKIFTFLVDIPMNVIQSPRNELVTATACQLIASSISLKEISLEGQSSVPHWRSIIDMGLKHRKSSVQEAAASAMSAISGLVDCAAVVQRFIKDFRSGSPMMQQSLAHLLGVMDYASRSHALPEAIQCLAASVLPSSQLRMSDVEARRNCMVSIQLIITSLSSQLPNRLSVDDVVSMLEALLSGLDDYTTDERGDVGSWVRTASIQGLTSVCSTLLTLANSDTKYAEYIPASLYQKSISGILKQGVERLDNVRQQAGEAFLRLLKCPVPSVSDSDAWRIRDKKLFEELLMSDAPEDDSASGPHGWQNSSWLFPKAVHFLEVAEYRPAVLAGLLISVGSKTDTTQRHVRNSLIAYAKKLPADTSSGGGYSVQAFAGDLIAQAKANLSLNTKVIPVLQAFNVLLEGDALEKLCDNEEGVESVQSLLSIASRGVSKLKSVQRIQECMKTVVNLLTMPQVSDTCIPHLVEFLTHPYPTIRAETAQYLYLFLQSRDIGKDTDEAEELLLETEWFSSESDTQEKAATLVGMLQAA